MMTLTLHIPALIVVNLLMCSYIMPVLARWKKNWCIPVALGSVSLSFIFAIFLAVKVSLEGSFSYQLGGWAAPWGIEFVVDHFSVFMLLTLTGVGLLILIYATQDLLHEIKTDVMGWYYTLYLLLMASMVGLALTNDLFNLFVFVEICAISSCAIISIKENRECIEASLKYLILSAVGSGAMLLGIAMIYMVTGHLNFTFVSAALPEATALYPRNIMAAMALFTAGIGVKAALFPLHVWLPDAHSSAPSPSSAILSGLVIKIYAVVFIKLFLKIFPWEVYEAIPLMTIVLVMASVGIIVGSMFAIVQEDIKKMLAYSSVAQIGYVFLGVALLSHNGVLGGILHIFNHALMKSMLFMSAGAIIYCTGIRKISDLKGIGTKMPLVMTVFSIGAFSMVGIPMTNGFISKWYLAIGALDVNRPLYVAVILLSSLLNGVYYLPIVVNAFFGERKEPLQTPHKLPLQMAIPLVILASAIIITGVFPKIMLGLADKAAVFLLNSN
jgi:multicomponent Na+:H+ antiporter subunit D